MKPSSLPDGLPDWIAHTFGCARDQLAFEMVAGDASPRRHLRVMHSAGVFSGELCGDLPAIASCIAMISPASENNEAFLYVGAKLAEAGVRTPQVWAQDMENGWFLLEDFGDQLLLPLLSTSTSTSTSTSASTSVEELYERPLGALARLSAIPCDGAGIPRYDADRLRLELAIFPQWFLLGLLNIEVGKEARKRIDDLTEYLIAVFSEQPTVWVHRDYHSRNLMLLDDGDLGVIDFQDAVLGPVTYDPASLLKDCYIRLHRNDQLQALDNYLDKLKVSDESDADAWSALSRLLATQLAEVSPKQFRRWFDLTGLQRHLRVLGVFARLHLRDHKSGYLADLPLVVEYVREALVLTAATDSSVADFQQWFEADVMPVVIEQSWYQPINPEGWVR